MTMSTRIDVFPLHDLSYMILEVEWINFKFEIMKRPCCLAMLCSKLIGMGRRNKDIMRVFRIGYLYRRQNICIASYENMAVGRI